jgi:hypothetical protein
MLSCRSDEKHKFADAGPRGGTPRVSPVLWLIRARLSAGDGAPLSTRKIEGLVFTSPLIILNRVLAGATSTSLIGRKVACMTRVGSHRRVAYQSIKPYPDGW